MAGKSFDSPSSPASSTAPTSLGLPLPRSRAGLYGVGCFGGSGTCLSPPQLLPCVLPTLGADSPGPINAVPAEVGASYVVFVLLQTPDLQSGCISCTLPESQSWINGMSSVPRQQVPLAGLQPGAHSHTGWKSFLFPHHKPLRPPHMQENCFSTPRSQKAAVRCFPIPNPLIKTWFCSALIASNEAIALRLVPSLHLSGRRSPPAPEICPRHGLDLDARQAERQQPGPKYLAGMGGG